MNLFTISTWAGILGAILVNLLTYLLRWLGIPVSLPWEIAASVFLNPPFIRTLSGIIIGLAGTVALSTATALFIGYTLAFTGYNRPGLKGVIVSDALGFINLGLFMPLLRVWPQIRNEPQTNLLALVILSLMGYIQGLLLYHWQSRKVR